MASPIMNTQAADALSVLGANLNHTTALIKSLQSALIAAGPPPNAPSTPTPPNALALLATSAALIKAQATHLSLLSLNKPFTPTAITSTLRTIAKLIPSLVAGAQYCAPPVYPGILSADVRGRVRGVLLGMERLLAEVPRTEAGDAGAGEAEADEGHRLMLRGTGALWEDCDWIVAMAENGVGLWAAERVKWWGELVGDALEEVEAWVEEGEQAAQLVDGMSQTNMADTPDVEGDDDDEMSDDAEEMFGPKSFDQSLRPIATRATKTISLVRLLFPPLLKRRIGRFPKLSSSTTYDRMPAVEQCARLDGLVEACKFFSEETDEVVAALYAANAEEVEKRLGGLGTKARGCLQSMRENWEGAADEFTSWTAKWLDRLDET